MRGKAAGSHLGSAKHSSGDCKTVLGDRGLEVVLTFNVGFRRQRPVYMVSEMKLLVIDCVEGVAYQA